VSEDDGDHFGFGVGDEGDDATAAGTAAASGDVDLVRPAKQLRPGKVEAAGIVKGSGGR
jgi:hypothetical protein